MNTIFVLFILSFTLSLLLTPVVGRVARRYGVVDVPSARKIHTGPIPRAGGVAIFLSFFLPFSGAFFYYNQLLSQVYLNQSLISLAVGATIVFLLGLFDDIRPLPASLKFLVQILAAMLAMRSLESSTDVECRRFAVVGARGPAPVRLRTPALIAGGRHAGQPGQL